MSRIVLQIHDELLFEGPESEVADACEIVQREMAGAFEWPAAFDLFVTSGEEPGVRGAARARRRRPV